MIDYIGRFVSTVANALEFNQATLSGCIDVIVVAHEDGTFMCTPFNVRFGKLKLLRSREKKISIFVNDVEAPFKMRLGVAGDGYFEEQPSLCGVIKDSETEIKMPPELEKETETSDADESEEKMKSSSGWSRLWRKAPDDAVQIEKEKEKEMKDATKKLLGKKATKIDDEKEIERIMNPEIDKQVGRGESLKQKIKGVLTSSEKENEGPVETNIEQKQQKQETEKGKKPLKIALDENQPEELHHEETRASVEHVEEEEDEETKKRGLFRSLMHFLKNHHPFHRVTVKVGNRIIHLPSLHGGDDSLKHADMPEVDEGESFADALEGIDFHKDEKKHSKHEKHEEHEMEKALHEENHSNLELSLCGAAVYGKPKEDLNEIFEEHRVPYKDFLENPYKILSDPNLMVKMGNNLYDWKVACPLIISLIGYKKIIPEETLHDIATKEAMPSSSHWKNWFKFLKRKKTKKIEKDMEEDEEINRERKELAEQFEEANKPTEEDLKIKEATEQPKGAKADLKIKEATEQPKEAIVKPEVEPEKVEKIAQEAQKPKTEDKGEKKPDIIEMICHEIENKTQEVKDEIKPAKEEAKSIVKDKPLEIPAKPASDDTKKEMAKILVEEEKLHHQAQNAPVSEEKPPMVTENQIIRECLQQEKALEKLEGKKVEKKKVWRTLRPTSDMLKSLNLKPGCNVVVYKVDGSKKEKRLTANIYLWPANSKIILSDIDGTITKSDGLGQLMPVLGRDWSQPGVCKLYNSIRKNGYQIMYLTARAIGQSQLTKNFLNTLVQDGCNLPPGPVILSPDLLVPAFKREVIYRKPEVFKIAYLRDLRSIFPTTHNPFYAGFGNRETDAIAYQAVGVLGGKIFTINPVGAIRLLNTTYSKSYGLINGLVDQMFPGIEEDDKYQASEEYNEVNYFKVNYESLVEDFDVHELVDTASKK